MTLIKLSKNIKYFKFIILINLLKINRRAVEEVFSNKSSKISKVIEHEYEQVLNNIRSNHVYLLIYA